MIPIWKDTYYVTSDDVVDFEIVYNGTVIYSGRGIKPEGEAYQRIRVNGICAPYLSPLFSLDYNNGNMPDDLTASTQTAPAVGTFSLYVGDSRKAEYQFMWCYDMTTDVNYAGQTINNPVNTHTAANMLTTSTTITGDGYNTTFTRAANPQYCADYALYYVNLKGGWDSFLIEGKATKTYNYTNVNTSRSYDNTTVNYSYTRNPVDIYATWTVNTGYLNDRESDILSANLLSSPWVIIHDLKRDLVDPVVITDTSCERKTYSRGNMNAYTISLRESQSNHKQ